MKKSGLTKTWIRILLTFLTAAMMAQIFCFSMETAEESDATSLKYAEQVISVLHPEYDTYPEERQQTLLNSVQHAVRKLAHFAEYTLLGILLRLCLESWFGKRRWLGPVSWITGAFYACTDELHQMMTDGRSGQWTDVILDSSGVFTGVLLVSLVLARICRRKQQNGVGKACP